MNQPHDRRWMLRALRLAVRSCGATWPNPGVGCVLVRDNRCIGQGRHQRCGGPHGEIEALNDCAQNGLSPQGATAFVTLAPCTKYGRTPPCTDALIKAGVTRVVAACVDPNQDAAAERFAAAGIRYDVGLCSDLAEQLHGGFLSRISTGRPRVTGKWAMTVDGFLACANGASAWISSSEALALSRRRRRAFDAIIVGAQTVAADNPSLQAQAADERTPVRIVLSAQANIAPDLRLYSGPGAVWCVHDQRATSEQLQRLQERGVQCLAVENAHTPEMVLQALGTAGFNDVLIEGGAHVHGAFHQADAYDRLEIYQGGPTLGAGMPVAELAAHHAPMRIADKSRWVPEVAPRLLGDTVLSRWRRA